MFGIAGLEIQKSLCMFTGYKSYNQATVLEVIVFFSFFKKFVSNPLHVHVQHVDMKTNFFYASFNVN